MQPIALINEVFRRLDANPWANGSESCKQFFRIATRAVRRILVDHARVKCAALHVGIDVPREFDGTAAPQEAWEGMIELDDRIAHLERVNARQAAIVEFMLFSNLSIDDIARVLDAPAATIAREWRMARAWLKRADEARLHATSHAYRIAMLLGRE